jgi:TRAP-type mannitol/chloroaromatic compound transport system permease small subunit
MSADQALATLAARIDRLTAVVGCAVTWCVLAIALVEVVVVLMRYVLGLGSIWLSEAIGYAHAALFMGAAAWTLQQGGHVRVDIFYADAAPRTRALVDLAGALILLLPFVAVLAWFSIPYVARSWAILERSPEASGLPLVFLFKTLIPAFAVLLGLQGIAQAARAWLIVAGAAPRETGR